MQRYLVCSPTDSGKTKLVRKFLANLDCMSDTPFQRIVLHNAQLQPSYRELGPKVEFCEGLSRSSEYSNDRSSKLLIINDLMRSHYCNASVIFVAQNVFHQEGGQ